MLLGIGFVMRTGKDTAATALCRDLGFRRVGFADRLKDLALAADPLITSATRTVNVSIGHGRLAWLVKGLGWEAAKDDVPEVRLFLQRLGVGARQVFGDDFWVEAAFQGIRPEDHIVFPDVRFPNEAEAIRSRGGKVIRIDRPGHRAGGHESETALCDYEFDALVPNTGSVQELEQYVVDLVGGWIRDASRPPQLEGQTELPPES